MQLGRIITVVVLACLAAVAPTLAGSTQDCATLPDGVILEPGRTLRLGERTFDLTAALRESADADRATSLELQLDLLARFTVPGELHVARRTYQPHLVVTYGLAGPAGDKRAAGELVFRLTDDGPGYGATLPFDVIPGEPLRIVLEIAERGPVIRRSPTDCSPFPLKLTYELRPDRLPIVPAVQPVVRSPADDSRLTLLGAYDPLPGENYSDVWGYSDGTTHLAIIGTTDGTLFINVNDPGNPEIVANVKGPDSSWRDIKTYGHHAYMVTEGIGAFDGLQIVDMSDPARPQVVGNTTAFFNTAHNIYIDTGAGLLYAVGTNAGTRILSLADPVNPVEVGSFGARYVHDAQIDNGLACLSEINNGIQELADPSVPGTLSTLSTWPTPNTATHNCWANDLQTVLVTTDEVFGGHVGVYDIGLPNQPALLGEYDPNPPGIVHNAMFDDFDNETVGISYYSLGIRYIDVHRPTRPVELGAYDTYPNNDNSGSGAWGVYMYDPRGYIYGSDIQTGLYVLRYDPTGGTLSGIVSDAQSGQPLPAAEVVVLPDGIAQNSAADGVYAVYAEEGPIQLWVRAMGYASRLIDAGTLPLGGRLDVDVALEPLPVRDVSGFVRRAADLSPIGGATVGIHGGPAAAQTAADGSYTLTGLPVGQTTVTAEAFGFSPGAATLVLSQSGAATVDLLLEAGRFADDAETDQGWTLGDPADQATEGLWERVDPNGTAGGAAQPENDATPAPGTLAFVTGQSPPGADREINDVEGGATTLISPTIDATGLGAARLSYARWVSTASGLLPGGNMRVDVSPDDGFGWTTIEFLPDEANAWIERQFDLGGIIPLTSELRVRFVAQPEDDLQEFKVLECGIDDFQLVRSCEALFNPTGDDFDRDGLLDPCDGCLLDSANDVDGDGVCGNLDNAPFVANDQTDADTDGVGDAGDNCPADANGDQRDLDDDGLGDACDADLDGDGIDDTADGDDDNDGVADAIDLCPSVPDGPQSDRDTDGTGDLCDPDDGEVQGLRIDGDLLTWEPETDAGSYSIYRGDLGPQALLALSTCGVDVVLTTYHVDAQLPLPGDGFTYLVTRTTDGIEGPLGFSSAGDPRQVQQPCP